MENFKEAVSPGPKNTDVLTNSQRLWQPAQGLRELKPDRNPVLKGENGQGLPPLTKKLSTISTKGKLSFLQWSPWYVSLRSGRPMSSSGWHKVVFLKLCVSHCFVWDFFCLIRLLFLYFGFHSCVYVSVYFFFLVVEFLVCLIAFLRKKYHKVGWVGVWGGIRRSWGREKP